MFGDGEPVYAYVLLALAMLLGMVPALLLEVMVLKAVISKGRADRGHAWDRPIAIASLACVVCAVGTTAYLIWAGRQALLPSTSPAWIAIVASMTAGRWVIEFGLVRREPAKLLAASVAGTLLFLLFEPVVVYLISTVIGR